MPRRKAGRSEGYRVLGRFQIGRVRNAGAAPVDMADKIDRRSARLSTLGNSGITPTIVPYSADFGELRRNSGQILVYFRQSPKILNKSGASLTGKLMCD